MGAKTALFFAGPEFHVISRAAGCAGEEITHFSMSEASTQKVSHKPTAVVGEIECNGSGCLSLKAEGVRHPLSLSLNLLDIK